MSETEVPDYLLEADKEILSEMLGNLAETKVQTGVETITLRKASNEMAKARELKNKAGAITKEVKKELTNQDKVILRLGSLNRHLGGLDEQTQENIQQDLSELKTKIDGQPTIMNYVREYRKKNDVNGLSEYTKWLMEQEEWEDYVTADEKAEFDRINQTRNISKKDAYNALLCGLIQQRALIELRQAQREAVAAEIAAGFDDIDGQPLKMIGEKDRELTKAVINTTNEVIDKRLESSDRNIASRLIRAESQVVAATENRYAAALTMGKPEGVDDAQWERSQGGFMRLAETDLNNEPYPEGYSSMTPEQQRTAMDEYKKTELCPVGEEFEQMRRGVALLQEASEKSDSQLENIGVVMMRAAVDVYQQRLDVTLRNSGFNTASAKVMAESMVREYKSLIAKNRLKPATSN